MYTLELGRYSVVGIGISDVNLLNSGHLSISACAITVRNIIILGYSAVRSRLFLFQNLKLKFPHSVIMLFLSLVSVLLYSNYKCHACSSNDHFQAATSLRAEVIKPTV